MQVDDVGEFAMMYWHHEALSGSWVGQDPAQSSEILDQASFKYQLNEETNLEVQMEKANPLQGFISWPNPRRQPVISLLNAAFFARVNYIRSVAFASPTPFSSLTSAKA
jgi:hypothetical protein